jgi:hypothetical protein
MATKTLTASARAGLNWTYTNSDTFGDTEFATGFSFSDSLATGTGADQADRLYVGSHTIAASGTLDLDLAGSLADVFGATLTFARVKAVLVTFQSDNTGSEVGVGAAASNQFYGFFNAATDQEKVHSSGCFFKWRADATGWAVTAGTGDLLRVTNLDGTNAAKINVAIIGASA